MKRSILILLAGLVGCAGPKYRMAVVEPDPAKYEKLGYASGDATGLLIGGVFKRALTNTIERAVEEAIASKDGDEIVDLTVQQKWWTAAYVYGFKIEVRGMVLRRIDPSEERARERLEKRRERLPRTEQRRRGIEGSEREGE